MADTLSVGGLTKNASNFSIGSIAKQRWQNNPLYGHSIESVVAVSNNTQVYRIRAEVYNKYLNPDN